MAQCYVFLVSILDGDVGFVSMQDTILSIMLCQRNVPRHTLHQLEIFNRYSLPFTNRGMVCMNNNYHSLSVYLVQSTSACRLPWQFWHWVHNLANFSSNTFRWEISFWKRADSLDLQCLQTAASLWRKRSDQGKLMAQGFVTRGWFLTLRLSLTGRKSSM